MVKLSTEEFILKSKCIHGDKYDYSKVNYILAHNPVCITCKEHGDFWQQPNVHLSKRSPGNCPICAQSSRCKTKSLTTEEFILKSNKVHPGIYNYDTTVYKHNKIKVNIICKIHGEFLQSPFSHLAGRGCPVCDISKLENLISINLNAKNISFEIEKTFSNCVNINTNRKLSFDFWLPEKNILIEADGKQHYEYVPYLHRNNIKNFETQKSRDKMKTEYALANNIKLIRIPYWDIERIDNILAEATA